MDVSIIKFLVGEDKFDYVSNILAGQDDLETLRKAGFWLRDPGTVKHRDVAKQLLEKRNTNPNAFFNVLGKTEISPLESSSLEGMDEVLKVLETIKANGNFQSDEVTEYKLSPDSLSIEDGEDISSSFNADLDNAILRLKLFIYSRQQAPRTQSSDIMDIITCFSNDDTWQDRSQSYEELKQYVLNNGLLIDTTLEQVNQMIEVMQYYPIGEKYFDTEYNKVRNLMIVGYRCDSTCGVQVHVVSPNGELSYLTPPKLA